MTSRSLSPRDEPAIEHGLERFAAKVRRSSNFRFAWQFFTFDCYDASSPDSVLDILKAMVATGACHQFLRDSFEPMYEDSFEIESIHEHCRVVAAPGEVENILAAAANDHLGAYSSNLRDSTAAEIGRVQALFETLGPYQAFQLVPGANPECDACSHHNNHVFSSWFYAVAWDWCLVLTWPEAHRVWVGCLTDTD